MKKKTITIFQTQAALDKRDKGRNNLNMFNMSTQAALPGKASRNKSALGKFLTAEWRKVALLNYEVDPGLLNPYIPRGTELDFWRGRTFISLVGFRFLKTKMFGLAIPFHQDFEEVNLRFYVRRREGSDLRRGVSFIREVVPRPAVAAIARALYNENYVALPMSHHMADDGNRIKAEYAWQLRGEWNTISLSVAGEPQALAEGSEEEFIAEHYWGYAAQRDGGCMEYRVDHPSWRVWTASNSALSGDVEELYGTDFAAVLRNPPSSAFLAEGSPVTVFRGRKL